MNKQAVKKPTLDQLAGGISAAAKPVVVEGFEVELLVRDVPYADMQAIASDFDDLDDNTDDDERGVATMARLFERTLTDASGDRMTTAQAEGLVKNSSGPFLTAATAAIMSTLDAEINADEAKKNSPQTGPSDFGSDSLAT